MPRRAPGDLPRQVELLGKLYGPQAPPPARTALDWILWENAAYLVPHGQRLECFQALQRLAKRGASGLARARREDLLDIARRGGMQPEGRVQKWLEIARLVEDELGGELEHVLALPLPKARAVLKRFPGIGEPGAEKILLFTGTHPSLAPESNGLRVLVRLGHAREEKSYAATYRSQREALAPLAARGCAWLQRAHLLLQRHGQQTCKRTTPRCDECVLSAACPSADGTGG